MPKKGHSFQITEEWQNLVRRKLDELDMSQAELARQAKIRPSSLTAMLKKGALRTATMPTINKILGLQQPMQGPAQIVQEGASYLAELDEIEQGRWVERLRQAVEEKRRQRR